MVPATTPRIGVRHDGGRLGRSAYVVCCRTVSQARNHREIAGVSYVPPPMSEETRNRTHRCVRCSKLTDPRLEHCDACGHVFTAQEILRMQEGYEDRRRFSFSKIAFPVALVGFVVWVVLTW